MLTIWGRVTSAQLNHPNLRETTSMIVRQPNEAVEKLPSVTNVEKSLLRVPAASSRLLDEYVLLALLGRVAEELLA